MFGWEFPPFSTGGLGTACYGLTKSLSLNNVDIIFVLPKFLGKEAEYVDLVVADKVIKKIQLIGVNSILVPYISLEKYSQIRKEKTSFEGEEIENLYGENLFEEVSRYAQKAKLIARQKQFDIIHCHDWMTFQAGIEAKKVSGKKLIIHVHATEFDRTGGHGVNQYVYNIEREGMHFADKVIAVSQLTKNMIVQHYGIHPDKIEVVYNAVERSSFQDEIFKINPNEKMVLFLGRVTLQKGPEYFLYAAQQILRFRDDVKFVLAGGGDMLPKMIELTAELGISDKVIFTGVVKGNEVDKLYRMADLYIMPSVSEPFGITPLESMINGTPVLISKQSGVSEVLTNALKVDFWDVNEITNKALAVLNYDVLGDELRREGSLEIKRFTWDRSAKKVLDVYRMCLGW